MTIGTITVAQLVAALLKCDQDRKVRISVADPKDTAYTNEVSGVYDNDDGGVTIRGWVSSDNEEACAPWSCD